MVVDASALLALLFHEPEAERIARALAADPRRLASAFTVLEAGIVVESRKGESGGRESSTFCFTVSSWKAFR